MRLLVAIASFGTKNMGFLKSMIEDFRAMPFTTDIVVLSEAPKDLPSDVRVLVGLPSSNPWSLPFAHKTLFADSVDQYDLFIYSEDDIGITADHIHGFLASTAALEDDEIAGFLRFERGPSGTTWMPDAHGTFHWEAGSVVNRGEHVFASYTNEHAAAYVVTQAQLKRAIASGGFVNAPYEAKYDMLCTAATDIYTACGFRKLVCVSDLPRSLVHHKSDRYAGLMGMPLVEFQQQLDTLMAIHEGTHPATTLCEVESKIARGEWSKDFYEKPHDDLLALVPAGARTVLSIGCGAGDTEAELIRRGASVTALPLDSVIAVTAARRGVKPVYACLDQGLRQLEGQTFDCVLVSNLLHLQRDPDGLFKRCAQFVAPGGALVIDSPNFNRLPILARFALNPGYRDRRNYEKGGISAFGPGLLTRAASTAGLSVAQVRWYDHSMPKLMRLNSLPLRLGSLTAGSWILRADRTAAA